MTTNLLSDSASPSAAPAEPRGLIPLVVGALVLAARRYLKHKAAGKPEPMTRTDFLTEIQDIQNQMHKLHLALLEKLDANHRELLAALERQAARISPLESGLARLDERTTSRAPRNPTPDTRPS